VSVARADAVAGAVARRELDALLICDLVNVRWLAGFTGSSAAAVVGAGARGARRFVTDFRYRTQAADQIDPAWATAIASDPLAGVADALGEVAAARGTERLRVGFDDHHLSVRAHARLSELLGDAVSLEPAGGLVEELRAVKDPGELAAIRAAAQVADEAFTQVVARGLVGRTEQAVALDLEMTMRGLGAQGSSFPPIVAAGAHGALPHAVPRDVAIAAGTLVVIDWGAQLDGYASDCTRTLATGDIDAGAREVYELVLRAQEAALAAVRPGPTGKEVDAVARDLIAAGGHGERFGHGLGHGVGLEVHEGPRLSKQGEDALVAGNVVTVEPGIYVPGEIGVRIEDLVAVTAEGHEVLNGLPKDLTVAG
jgi:Xaa-Pro aminopeptidase